eukprot:1961143-Rhodomonas_salina.1
MCIRDSCCEHSSPTFAAMPAMLSVEVRANLPRSAAIPSLCHKRFKMAEARKSDKPSPTRRGHGAAQEAKMSFSRFRIRTSPPSA